MRSVALLALMVSFSLAAQTAQDAATGSIEGTVVDGVTGQPVENAWLTLQPSSSGSRVFGALPIPPFQTGPDGKFAFASLRAGAYSLETAGNGYVRQNYGQKIFPAGYGGVAGEGTTIPLAADEALKGLTIRLTPTGTITGRIRDAETKQAVVGVPVQLFRYIYRPDGERTLEQFGSARTNDRGEYRLYFLTPGRYYVQAGGTIAARGPVSIRPGNENEVVGTYPVVFFPAAATVSDASIVDVKAGTEIGATDMLVATRQNLYRIRGRVFDSATGQTPPAATISLYRRSGTRWENDGAAAATYRAADGSFEFLNIISGSYLIRVDARSTPQRFAQSVPSTSGLARVVAVAYQAPAPRPPDVRGYATKVVPVTIAGSDVDTSVPVSPGISLTGRVRVEGRTPSIAEWNGLRVFITSPDSLLRANSPVTVLNGEASIQLNDVTPGEYRLSMSLPRGFYMKEARFVGADALQTSFQVSDRETAGLALIISPNVARVEGSVANDKLENVADAAVVLVPERDRDRAELFQSVPTDRDGRFVFPNIPPGNYKMFAWEVLEPYSYFDPEVLRRVEQRGRTLQLRESSTTSLSLTAIPPN